MAQDHKGYHHFTIHTGGKTYTGKAHSIRLPMLGDPAEARQPYDIDGTAVDVTPNDKALPAPSTETVTQKTQLDQ